VAAALEVVSLDATVTVASCARAGVAATKAARRKNRVVIMVVFLGYDFSLISS